MHSIFIIQFQFLLFIFLLFYFCCNFTFSLQWHSAKNEILHKKWDMNPESDYIEGSSARLEEMVWENVEDEGVDNTKGKGQWLD